MSAPAAARAAAATVAALALAAASTATAQSRPSAPPRSAGERPAPAPDDEVVARFVLGGEPSYVTRIELASAFVQREFGTPRANEALDHLVTIRLVMTEAEEKGLLPDEPAIRARTDEFREGLRQQGRSLEQFLDENAYDVETFRRLIVVPSIASERLVMHAMGFDDASRVTSDLMQLWAEEARERRPIRTDPMTLGPDLAATVGDEPISRLELGEMLMRTADDQQRREAIERVVLRRLIDDAADAAGVEITLADLQAEVARRREIAADNPDFEGIPFDQLLATQGLTPDSFARSPVLLAQVQQQRIIDRTWTDEAVRDYIDAHRDEVLAAHGARRKLSILLLRASEEPNELVPRTFELARTRAEELRAEIRGLAEFAEAARKYSDEPATKAHGGAIGWHHRASEVLPEPLLDAAWSTPTGSTSEPVRTAAGVWLVHVDAVEPRPELDVLIERVRADRARAWRARLLDEARLEIL